jgi:hypothetical protein
MPYPEDQVNTQIAMLESNGNYGAANPESSARGKYQFMPATFEGVKKNNPDLPQLSWEEFQKNPDAQEQYQGALRAENQAVLDKHGIEKTPVNEYILHWAGGPKGTALLKAQDTDVLGDFINEKVLAKNRLTPDTTIADFKSNIDRKMNAALGVKSNLAPAGNEPMKSAEPMKLTAGQKEQMAEWDALHERVQKLQPGTPEFNTTIADSLETGAKKEFGPNWTNAVIAALMGNKDQALTWITGGMNDRPQIAEAIVNGTTRQIWINKNQRGDTWFTDPATGKRLPDTTQITSTTPEGAIGTGIVRQAAEVRPEALGGKPLTLADQQAHKATQAVVTERNQSLPTESGLISSISTGTKTFAKTLDNITRGPQAEAFMKALSGIGKGGLIDEEKIKEAVTLANLPPEQRGEFAQYLRNISTANQMDKDLRGKHAPGAGIHGELDLSGGAKGVNQWLANRSTSYAFQKAWNDYYDQNKNQGTVSQITRNFEASDTYEGIKNYKRIAEARITGKPADLKNGDKVADFDRSGKLVLKTYNAKTGKVE